MEKEISFKVRVDRRIVDEIVINDDDMIHIDVDVCHNSLPLSDIELFLQQIEALAFEMRICYDLCVVKKDGTKIGINCCRT